MPLFELYNHSGVSVRVFVGDDSYDVAPESTQSLGSLSQSWGEVRVCLHGKLLRYTLVPPPNDYCHGIELLILHSRIRVQLQPDGRLWTLRRGEAFPIPEHADQPDPYPLSPREVGTCEL